MTVTQEESADHAQGTVIRTDPTAGSTIKAGETVTLFVAKPPSTNAIPNLQNMTVTQVSGIAQEFGVTLAFAPGSSQDGNAIVQGQVPQQGTQMKPGDTLTIFARDQNGGGGFINGGNGG